MRARHDQRQVSSRLDLLAVIGALLLALWNISSTGLALPLEHSLAWGLLSQHPLWFLLLSLLWLPLAYAFDAYDLRVAGCFSRVAPAMLKAGAITAGVYLLIPYLPQALPPSRSALFASFLILDNPAGEVGAPGEEILTQMRIAEFGMRNRPKCGVRNDPSFRISDLVVSPSA